jgi:hypothetical protein
MIGIGAFAYEASDVERYLTDHSKAFRGTLVSNDDFNPRRSVSLSCRSDAPTSEIPQDFASGVVAGRARDSASRMSSRAA